MVHRLARHRILAAWVVLALGAAGCASKQVTSPPTSPPPQTHEQGEPATERAGGAGSQGGTGSSEGSESEGTGENGGRETTTGDTEGGGASGAEDTTESELSRPSGSAMTPAEERSEGDRKLDESLAEFESRLRGERSRLAEANDNGGGSGSSDATESGGESTGGQAGAPAGDRANEERGAQPGDPANLPDGSDDDIVAQQLRELAESEKDPEKRAIYWQDYLDYKSGKRSKTGRQEEGGADDGAQHGKDSDE
jgi:hypothetical protein